VVSSLSGANYVVLVTEPSMSGLHDLERVHEVIKRFRIKSGCIINKSDINPDKMMEIKDFLTREKIDHLADIPYDPAFTNAMTEGKTIVEIKSPLKTKLEETWELVKSKLNQ